MPRAIKRGLISAVVLIACTLVLSGVWPDLFRPSPSRWQVEDASYHFTFCQVTHGTNHTVSSGLPAFGWLNRKLIQSGLGRMGRDQLYSWRTDQVATCLSVGFKHDGEILRSDPTNGLAYPVEYRHLEAVIVDAGGHPTSLHLPQSSSGMIYIPQTREHMHRWNVPDHITNFYGCKLRLSRDGKNVAILNLQ